MTTPQSQGRYFRDLGVAAARAADDKKGTEIVLLHTKLVSPLADYVLIVGATSPPHIRALEEHIRFTLKTGGTYAQHRDGRESDLWRVLDYGGLLVHLMHPKAREFYAIDRLFHEARSVEWNPNPAPKKKAPARKPAARKSTGRKKAGRGKPAKKRAGKRRG